jgi:hypothetical protein
MLSQSRATVFAPLQFVIGAVMVLILGASASTAVAADQQATIQTGVANNGNMLLQTTPSETPFDDQRNPVLLLASYYNAINLGAYARAYDYWEGNAPNAATLQQFSEGFANTERVQGWAVLPQAYEGAAGSIYTDVPVLLRVTTTNGEEQFFAGCLTARRSNVPAGDATEPDPNWHLYDGSLEQVDSLDVSEATADCSRVETFPLSSVFNDATDPVNLLTSYYDAIAQGDYARAYSYWVGQPRNQTLEDFVDGFIGTDNIGLIVGLEFRTDAAAGNVYTATPTIITATNNEVSQFFAGCFVARKSNVPVGDATEPDPNWHFDSADIAPIAGLEEGLEQTGQSCA